MDEIAMVADELVGYCESPTVSGQVTALLEGICLEPGLEVPLHGDWALRRLTPEEVSTIYSDVEGYENGWVYLGGGGASFDNPVALFADHGLVRVFPVSKDNSEYGTMGAMSRDADVVKQDLIVGLRSFKGGSIGLHSIHWWGKGTFPGGGGRASESGPHVPIASSEFTVARSESPALIQHLSDLMRADRAMKQACDRVSKASERKDDLDAILDAVIGMESILLHGLGAGESVYRFATNYALTEDDRALRFQAFERAKALYNVRSKIAHGEDLDTITKAIRKFAGPEANPSIVALKAASMLRAVIQKFLPQSGDPPYKEADYWSKAVLRGSLW